MSVGSHFLGPEVCPSCGHKDHTSLIECIRCGYRFPTKGEELKLSHLLALIRPNVAEWDRGIPWGIYHDARMAIDEIVIALRPFIRTCSSEPTTTITVPSEAIWRLRRWLDSGSAVIDHDSAKGASNG